MTKTQRKDYSYSSPTPTTRGRRQETTSSTPGGTDGDSIVTAVTAATPSGNSVATKDASGVPLHVRKQLAKDIYHAGGIALFDKNEKQALSNLLDNPDRDCYGEKRGHPLRRKIQNLVYSQWKVWDFEKFYKKVLRPWVYEDPDDPLSTPAKIPPIKKKTGASAKKGSTAKKKKASESDDSISTKSDNDLDFRNRKTPFDRKPPPTVISTKRKNSKPIMSYVNGVLTRKCPSCMFCSEWSGAGGSLIFFVLTAALVPCCLAPFLADVIPVDPDHLECTPKPFIVRRAWDLVDVEDPNKVYEGFIIEMDVDLRDVLGSEKTDVLPTIPPFPFSHKVDAHHRSKVGFQRCHGIQPRYRLQGNLYVHCM